MSIPCIGGIYILWGAFAGDNESRKNYFRAHIAWFVLIMGLYITLFTIGLAPDIRKIYDQYQREQHALPKKSNKPAHRNDFS